ncbi:MAG: hypothetical protein Q4E03_05270 [Trueperella sp.]|nr:hypothetical protein [Trueperella sp.]
MAENNYAADDMDVLDFAKIVSLLPPYLPITDDFIAQISGTDERPERSEREHMVGWYQGQATTGSGQYTRNVPNRSAKRAYNRLLNPASVLWIAEAVGVDEQLVREAAAKALAEPAWRSRPRVAREVLPWELVFEKAKHLPKSAFILSKGKGYALPRLGLRRHHR